MPLTVNNSESVFGIIPSFGHIAPPNGAEYVRVDPTRLYPFEVSGTVTFEFWAYFYEENASLGSYFWLMDQDGVPDVEAIDRGYMSAFIGTNIDDTWRVEFYITYPFTADDESMVVLTGTGLQLGQWHHICLELEPSDAYEGQSRCTLYIDGTITNPFDPENPRAYPGWDNTSVADNLPPDFLLKAQNLRWLFAGSPFASSESTRAVQMLFHDLRITEYADGEGPRYGGEFSPPSADFPSTTIVTRTMLHTGNYQTIVGGSPFTITATWTFQNDQVIHGSENALVFWNNSGEDISEVFGGRDIPEWESSVDLGDNPDGVLLRFSWTGTEAVDIRRTGVYEFNDSAWVKYQRLNEPDTINTQSGTSYTLQLSDASKRFVRMTSESANAVTVPNNASVAFPIGTRIPIRQAGTGLTSLVADVGVTLNATSLDSAGQHSTLWVEKVAEDEWDAWGDLA